MSPGRCRLGRILRAICHAAGTAAAPPRPIAMNVAQEISPDLGDFMPRQLGGRKQRTLGIHRLSTAPAWQSCS
jgi:hypothetical protein